MAERIEPGALAPDVLEPAIPGHRLPMLAVELVPRLERRPLRVEEQAVEVEDERAGLHARSVRCVDGATLYSRHA